jgi:hypothetical protein
MGTWCYFGATLTTLGTARLSGSTLLAAYPASGRPASACRLSVKLAGLGILGANQG